MCNDTVKTNPLDNSIGMNLTSKMKDEFIFNCWQGNYYLLERVMGESDEHKKKIIIALALLCRAERVQRICKQKIQLIQLFGTNESHNI